MRTSRGMRAWRRCIATLALCALCAGQVWAQTDRVFADIVLNGESKGRTLVVLRDGDVLLPEADVRRLGIATSQIPCATVAQQRVVSLSALSNGLRFTFDERNLTVSITQNPSQLPHKRVSLLDLPTVPQREFLPGAVLDYSIHAAPRTPLSGSLTQRINLRRDVVLENTVGRTVMGAFVRGSSSLTIDDPNASRRTTFGDATIVGSDGLSVPLALAGVSVAREFSLDPYTPAFPMPSVQTTVTEPSQADIYVNGLLVKSVALAPGNYDLADIPMQAGYTNANVVIRNQFGVTSTNLTRYNAPSLLRKGLTDYQYAVGFLRDDRSAGIHGYGPLVASARYRIGTSAFTTLGAGVQASQGQVAGTVDYAAIWRLGFVHASVGASRTRNRQGAVLDVGYATSGSRSATSVEARFQSPAFAPVGALSGYQSVDRVFEVAHTERLDANTSLSVAVRSAAYQDASTLRELRVGLQRRMRDWNVSLGYAASTGTLARASRSFQLNVTRALNFSTTQTITAQSGDGSGVSSVISHAAISPFDMSYTVGINEVRGAAPVFAGTTHFGLPFLSGSVNVSKDGTNAAAFSGDFGGAAVIADGHLLFSQPIEDAYALVSSNGIPSAPVYVNGRYAGRTNKAGYALIPGLASSEISNVSISSSGLPLQNDVDENGRRTQPGYHAGSLVRFAAHRIHAVFGTLRVRGRAGAAEIPQFGEATLSGPVHTTQSSPIDEDGRFYFDRVVEGPYTLTVSDSHGTCTTTIRVPAFSDPAKDLGSIECAE